MIINVPAQKDVRMTKAPIVNFRLGDNLAIGALGRDSSSSLRNSSDGTIASCSQLCLAILNDHSADSHLELLEYSFCLHQSLDTINNIRPRNQSRGAST